MAKRKVATQSGRARRAPGGAPRSRAGQAGSRQISPKKNADVAGPRKRASAKAGGDHARTNAKAGGGRTKAAKVGATSVRAVRPRQGRNGSGAARPDSRGTVELLERATNEDSGSSTLPSSLDFDQRPSAARSGRAELEGRYRDHNEAGPGLTGGDVDADWESAYSVGDEAPGGDNPTPGQTIVEDVGRALGVEYEDGEELKGADKIETRDRHRWELDPASSEDYPERTKGGRKKKR